MSAPKVCLVGAGCSGITTAKRLKDFGIDYDHLELSDDVGGNWYYGNPNQMSAAYQSLHIDTSKARLAFEDFPVPEEWPDFPHHSELHQYFRDYVDHFGLRDNIEFGTGLERAVRRPSTGSGGGAGWDVTLSTGEQRSYTDLVLATGHHWSPRMPDYPGHFDGVLMHSHAYRSPFEPVDMREKTVIVVGMGNSGLDLASELSPRWLTKKLYVSARRGVWVLSKYRNGMPADKMMTPPDIPREEGLRMARAMIKEQLGRMSDYGLPEPDHEPLSAHPSVSPDFLTRVGSGDIEMLPAISRLDGHTVHLVDGNSVEADVIVCATGYDIRFPFFDADEVELHPDSDHRFPLFKRMIKPGVDHLFFMGLAQSSPTIVNLAEQQSKLLARLLTGQYVLPGVEEQEQIMRADEEDHLRQYYSAPRHTIQIDFARYCVDLHAEIAAGEERARARVGASQ